MNETLHEHISLAIATWAMDLPVEVSHRQRQELHEAIAKALEHVGYASLQSSALGGDGPSDGKLLGLWKREKELHALTMEALNNARKEVYRLRDLTASHTEGEKT